MIGDGIEARKGEGEMGAALVVCHGVDFVDDDGADGLQHFAGTFGGEKDEKRLGCGDEDVRGFAAHPRAIGRGSVAGAHVGVDGREPDAALDGEFGYFGERDVEVLADVVGESFEGRDIEDLGFVCERVGAGSAHKSVETDEECSERLTRAGGGGDEHVASCVDLTPPGDLRLGGLTETVGEPFGDEGVEMGQVRHDPIIIVRRRKGEWIQSRRQDRRRYSPP